MPPWGQLTLLPKIDMKLPHFLFAGKFNHMNSSISLSYSKLIRLKWMCSNYKRIDIVTAHAWYKCRRILMPICPISRIIFIWDNGVLSLNNNTITNCWISSCWHCSSCNCWPWDWKGEPTSRFPCREWLLDVPVFVPRAKAVFSILLPIRLEWANLAVFLPFCTLMRMDVVILFFFIGALSLNLVWRIC